MTETLSVQQLVALFRRFFLTIFVATLLGGVGGYVIASLGTPTYSATATQLVKGLPGAQAAANYEASQYAISRAKSYPAFIHSTRVLEAVKADTGSSADINRLAQDLSAENPPDTPLIEVTAVGPTAEIARDKANSAARHLARFISQIETVSGTSPVSVETAVQAILPVDPIAPRPILTAALSSILLGCFTFAAAIAISRLNVRPSRATVRSPQQKIAWWDGGAGRAQAKSARLPAADFDADLDQPLRDEQRSSATLA